MLDNRLILLHKTKLNFHTYTVAFDPILFFLFKLSDVAAGNIWSSAVGGSFIAVLYNISSIVIIYFFVQMHYNAQVTQGLCLPMDARGAQGGAWESEVVGTIEDEVFGYFVQGY